PLRGESPLLAPAQRWRQVKGYYTAEGGESFLTIGNFLGANLQRINEEAGSGSRSYYFLDQVSVVKVEHPRTLALPGKQHQPQPQPQPQPSLPPACSCTVFFETGSSQIAEPAPQCLRQVLLAAQARPDWQLQIDGHTDDVGSEQANRDLSAARAGAVARFFTGQGVSSEKLSIQSFGATRPAIHSPAPEGRARNRRVEARLLPPPLQEWQFQALEGFAVLYGYVRFFHPYAPAEGLDWNRFAAYGASRISELEKEEEYLPLLRELFYPVAPTLALGRQGGKAISLTPAPPRSTAAPTYWQHYGYRIGEGNDVYRSVRVSPSAGVAPLFEGTPSSEPWRGVLPLGLHFALPLVLPDDHHAPDAGSLKKLEQALDEALLPDRDRQLANVILFWNTVQHFYPYRDILGEGWRQKPGEMLRQAAEIENPEAFTFFFKSCAALLKDGHAGLVHESELDDMWLPLELGWIEGQLMVTESGLPGQVNRGDILKKIDGQDAVAAFLRDTALYSGTPQWKVARALKNLGAGEQYSTAVLELERGGRPFRVEVQRDWGDFPEPALFRELEPGYFYVNLAAIYDIDTLLGWAPRLAEAEGVIFDVRGYLQNNCSRFLRHLLSEADTAGSWIKIPQLIYPDFFQPSFEKSGWLLTPAVPQIAARLAFLTDGRAVSASESFLVFVRHYRLGPIIGGPTAGANGPRNWVRLPDGYFLHWTGAFVTLLDGSSIHNKGIAPDYNAAATLKGILNGRDEVLELALSILKKNIK
ncbi:MAG: OmpA family protein, partial [Phaeodactylibacter sp.]|nr:OmpA family protein [Phaeodactylibacter sp.]